MNARPAQRDTLRRRIAPIEEGRCLAGGAGVLDDRPEQFPALAIELHHLQLLVDEVVADIPGSDRLPTKLFRLVACRIRFSRVRSSPH